MKFSFERIFVFFFILVIVGVVILGVVNYNANKSYFESSQWVDHTNEVIKESTMVLSTLQDMGVRIYLTTGDTSFLDTYHNAEKVLFPKLDHLQSIINDNQIQHIRLDSLRDLAILRHNVCIKYIGLKDQNKIDPPTLLSFTQESRSNMNSIRAIISNIISTEQILLISRKKENEKSRSNFNLSVALIFAEIVLLLIAVLAALIFYFYKRKKIERNILALNAELANNIVELHNANKELESFSYSVSHDLRAPLRIIDGFAKIMSEEYKDKFDDEAKRFVNAIRTNAQHMGQLIDDLLNFSRIGRQELDLYDVDMARLVAQVIESFNVLNKSPGAEIRVDHLGKVKCDAHLIRQVWINLLSNALKYSRKRDKPSISIGMEETDTEFVFSIIDNGVGFDMEYSDKLFGVFQRLHKVTDYEGTGVGLALVSRIVIRHRGRVWAHSVPDQGATFYFSLPK